MKNLDKYLSLLGEEVDGLLLTANTAVFTARSITSPKVLPSLRKTAAATLQTAAISSPRKRIFTILRSLKPTGRIPTTT